MESLWVGKGKSSLEYVPIKIHHCHFLLGLSVGFCCYEFQCSVVGIDALGNELTFGWSTLNNQDPLF